MAPHPQRQDSLLTKLQWEWGPTVPSGQLPLRSELQLHGPLTSPVSHRTLVLVCVTCPLPHPQPDLVRLHVEVIPAWSGSSGESSVFSLRSVASTDGPELLSLLLVSPCITLNSECCMGRQEVVQSPFS